LPTSSSRSIPPGQMAPTVGADVAPDASTVSGNVRSTLIPAAGGAQSDEPPRLQCVSDSEFEPRCRPTAIAVPQVRGPYRYSAPSARGAPLVVQRTYTKGLGATLQTTVLWQTISFELFDRSSGKPELLNYNLVNGAISGATTHCCRKEVPINACS
jgi:hypothetical protein